jgi:uncharacterized protein (DUF2132 family)
VSLAGAKWTARFQLKLRGLQRVEWFYRYSAKNSRQQIEKSQKLRFSSTSKGRTLQKSEFFLRGMAFRTDAISLSQEDPRSQKRDLGHPSLSRADRFRVPGASDSAFEFFRML